MTAPRAVALLYAWWASRSVATALAAGGRGSRMPSLSDRRSVSESSCRVCREKPEAFRGPAFDLGLATHRVPMALHALNRARLCERLVAEGREGVVVVRGGEQTTRYDTDFEDVFRQESYFQWLFGVAEPGFYGAVRLSDGRATLFAPDLRSEGYEVFCGRPPALDDVRGRYAVDACAYVEDLAAVLAADLGGGGGRVYLLEGVNSDSGNSASPAAFAGDGAFERDRAALFPAIADLRSRKTGAEVEVLRYVNWVSSMAHAEVLRAARPGMMEYQLESLFMHHTYTHGGCRHVAYTCICACGPNPAVLHYGHAGAPNARLLADGDAALLDMGAEYHCYAADVTCSYPVGAAFTDDQALVHGAVLKAQLDVIAALRPGKAWPDLHVVAERAILEALTEGGVLAGDVRDMLDVNLGAVFMPHGLGHLIGLDTHDVGGYLADSPPRPERPGLRSLRTARVVEAGMVLTVEPGCYFIDRLLDDALADPTRRGFLVESRIAALRGSGGVRLEDDVLVTDDGVENLTLCPRTVEEILSVKRGGPWPPKEDRCPGLRRSWVEPNPRVPGGPMAPRPLPARQEGRPPPL